VTVAQVDEMSGGRVELGLGAGWFDGEHKAYGIPFPTLSERFDRFEEQLAVITGLWETPQGSTFSYDGQYYPVTDSPALPKPVQRPRPPVIIGGSGKRRTPALAARYADEFNSPWTSPSAAAEQFARVRAAVSAAGREPSSIALSSSQVLCLGKDDAEVARRAAAIGREVGELKENGLAGSPAEIVDKIGQFAEVGVSRVYLQVLDLSDLAHLEQVASDVLPQV
jgi:alkanesulfonate monooxygenase